MICEICKKGFSKWKLWQTVCWEDKEIDGHVWREYYHKDCIIPKKRRKRDDDTSLMISS